MKTNLKDLIKTGKIAGAERIVISGLNGVGKSTLASQCPEPVLFLDCEDGSRHLDITRIMTGTEEEFFGALSSLNRERPPLKTLVIDPIDRAEGFIRQRVLKQHKMTNIEDFGYGVAGLICAKGSTRF
jgi:hypothetical protein